MTKVQMTYFILSLLFFTVYTEVGIRLAGVYVPSFFPLVACFAVYFTYFKQFKIRDLQFLFLIFVYLFISSIAAPNYQDINSRFLGVLQMGVAIAAFVAYLRILVNVPQNVAVKFYIYTLRAILFLTVLEFYGITTSLSDDFRNIAYLDSNYKLYIADERDFNMGDFLRPKVFTTEPSLVAVGFFIALASVLGMVKDTKTYVELFFYLVLEYLFLNSPIIIIGFIFLAFSVVRRNKFNVVTVSIVLFAVLLTAGGALMERLERFSPDRLSQTTVGDDYVQEKSERLRMVYPYLSIIDVMNANPFTGFGVSGKRSLEEYSSFTKSYQIAFGNNAFASLFIYFGLVGFLTFSLLIVNYLRVFNIDWLGWIMAVILFMQTMGGLETVRLWMYLAILTAAFSKGLIVNATNKPLTFSYNK